MVAHTPTPVLFAMLGAGLLGALLTSQTTKPTQAETVRAASRVCAEASNSTDGVATLSKDRTHVTFPSGLSCTLGWNFSNPHVRDVVQP